MALLEVRNLCMRFGAADKEVEVLKDLDFSVEEGEFVSILGPSGCGKTTSLRMIGGLVPYEQGSIKIGGQEVVGPGKDRGFVFQQDGLYPWLTVLENIVFGLTIRGVAKAEREAVGRRYVDLVGLSGFEKYFPYEISGGMRQRTNLARALVIDPAILLMDEPFAALDAQNREIMQHELLRICQQTGKTVLLVTHQIDEAIYLSKRVIVMSSRPGQVRKVIPIEFPWPRPLEIKRDPKFIQYTGELWDLIEGDVKREQMQVSSRS
jgi:NitT/TauT family transport system ATP-binding protein